MDLEKARRLADDLFGEAGNPKEGDPPSDVVWIGRREGQDQGFVEQLGAMTPDGFPIAELLLFGLVEFLGLRRYGPEEKMRWGVAFRFRGAFFAYEYTKFGLRLLCEQSNLDSPLVKEVLGRCRGLTDIVEAYLTDELVEKQMADGNITVENLYERLDFRYRFLREKAEAYYATPPPPPETGQSDSGGTWTRYDPGKPQREGGALATAAVDAFFSRSEHLFVLAYGLLGGGRRAVSVLDFLSSNWPAKARVILDLSDPKAKNLYDALLGIRERWRNPLAHGGFLSGGGSFYFHVPGVGALPAQLRRTPSGVKFGFRLTEKSFAEIARLFDEFDSHLAAGPLRHAVKWAAAGLDVAFDGESRSTYLKAMQSDEAFDDFLQWSSMDADRHDNMDY